MDDAPDAAAQPLDGTAPAAPPPTTAPATAPDKPVPDSTALLRSEFTRVSQKWSEAAKAAGLDPKSATPQQIVDALRPPEQGYIDPTVAQALATAEQTSWRYTGLAYPGYADAAREFAEVARTERDPETLTQLFHALTLRLSEAQAPAVDPAPATATAQTPEPISLGESDRPPTPPNAAPNTRADDSVTTHMRGLFKAAREAVTPGR